MSLEDYVIEELKRLKEKVERLKVDVSTLEIENALKKAVLDSIIEKAEVKENSINIWVFKDCDKTLYEEIKRLKEKENE